MKVKIAAIDFDGTLIKDDSIKLFCKLQSKNYVLFIIEYYILCRFLSIIKNEPTKWTLVKYFIKKKRKGDFEEILNKNLFDDSKIILDNLKKKGYVIVIVSASFFEIIGDFVIKNLNCKLISNRLENHSIDINGFEKLIQLKKQLPNSKIEIAYGNSFGDYPMLNTAKYSFLRHPNGELTTWQK